MSFVSQPTGNEVMEKFAQIVEAGADQRLHFDVPVAEPGRRYRVLVLVSEDSNEPQDPNMEAGWPVDFFERTSEQWQGDFERVEQMSLQEFSTT